MDDAGEKVRGFVRRRTAYDDDAITTDSSAPVRNPARDIGGAAGRATQVPLTCATCTGTRQQSVDGFNSIFPADLFVFGDRAALIVDGHFVNQRVQLAACTGLQA